MPAAIDLTADLPVYPSGQSPLTTHQLARMLRDKPNRLVVLSADSEGNHFSPLLEIGAGRFDTREFSGELYPTAQEMRDDPALARLFRPLPGGLHEACALYPVA